MSYDIDVVAFWEENERCMEPFSTNKPRVPMAYWLDDHYILGFMGIEDSVRYFTDFAYRAEMNRQANERLIPLLGRAFYSETHMGHLRGDFEASIGSTQDLRQGDTPWVMPIPDNSVAGVKKWIEEAARLDMKVAAFPDGWHEKQARIREATGVQVRLAGTGNTGPATCASHLVGTTELCLYIMDEPEMMDDFFRVLADKFIEYHEAVLQDDLGYVPREGFSINDDNSFLFSPRLYERFCAPFMERVFAAFAPEPQHKRRQHSDSAMGHIMPILNDIGVNEVNFGPTIHPADIRKAMPKAIIHGQIPPFTLKDGTPEQIIEMVRRDIDAVAADGGLVECPAGSVPIGTSIENLKVYMWAVQEYGRY